MNRVVAEAAIWSGLTSGAISLIASWAWDHSHLSSPNLSSACSRWFGFNIWNSPPACAG